jgi:ketosteroid isomerase-like protein
VATRVYLRPMDDSKTVTRRYVAAVQAGDEAVLRGMFAEDASWTPAAGDLPISGVWVGRDRILDDFLAR